MRKVALLSGRHGYGIAIVKHFGIDRTQANRS